MTSRYDLPHLDLSRRVQAVPFTSTASNPVGAGTPRSREEHGTKLRGELAAAYRAFDAARREDERIGPPEGAFLKVELKRGTRIETVERKREWCPRTDSRSTAMDQNTTARRIGWVESNVLSNSFSNSRVKWCPSFLISRKRSSSRFDLSSVSRCFRFAGSPKNSRKRL